MVYGTNYANLDPVTNLTLVPNRAPVPQAPLPPDRAGNAGSVFTFAIPASTFIDFDTDPLTFSAQLVSGAALPGWLRFDATSSSFTAAPGANDVGVHDVRVSATDPGGLAAFDDLQIIVAPQGFNALNYIAS